ncbi:hypothetical protein Bbelb_405480 [Branchiostoma belcheri]|nr:hypothetical protein Bbelb_405480 [Branchiostoma belcheri]
MYGAGKREIRAPARYALSPADKPEWPSTPAEKLAEQLSTEILDVSRRIERMKVDMGSGRRTSESTSTPLPTPPHEGDVIGQRSTIPEALTPEPQDGRHQLLPPRAPVQKPIVSTDRNYPTVREVRAFHRLHGDPSTLPQHFTRQTGGTQVADAIRSSAGRPSQAHFQHVFDDDNHPPTRGKKLTSGLSRKAHDRVIREVHWPHEFVFSANTTITHDSLTLDQLVAGEMAIILSPHTNHMESQNRAKGGPSAATPPPATTTTLTGKLDMATPRSPRARRVQEARIATDFKPTLAPSLQITWPPQVLFTYMPVSSVQDTGPELTQDTPPSSVRTIGTVDNRVVMQQQGRLSPD